MGRRGGFKASWCRFRAYGVDLESKRADLRHGGVDLWYKRVDFG